MHFIARQSGSMHASLKGMQIVPLYVMCDVMFNQQVQDRTT